MAGKTDTIYQKSPVLAQQAIVAIFGGYWFLRRHGQVFHNFVNELKSHEFLNSAEYQAYQEKLLSVIFAAAWHSPYYKDEFIKNDISPDMAPFAVLQKMPILTKAILHSRGRDLLTKTPLPKDSQVFLSSGTTGTPTEIIHTRGMLQKGQGWIEARSRNWAGLNYRSRRVMFGSRKICRFEQNGPPFWRISPIENMAYMSIYHLSPSFMPSYLAFLRQYRPELIMGYPSALYAIAKYAIATKDFPTQAKAIITTSEPVTKQVREALETAWGCKVFATYGSVEHCVFASECEAGNYHLSPEVGIVEVLDREGNACPPGVPGVAVCTGLHNSLQPLIRYQIGDVITLSTESVCSCGRTLPLIASIDGRLESMCYMPDGRMTLRFDTVFKGVDSILEAQVVQEEVDLFHIRVVPGEGFGNHDITQIRENMKHHAGNVKVEVVIEDEIERTKNGKFQSVICNLSQEEISKVLKGI